MILESIKNHLSDQFELLLFMDLADLITQHRKVFDVFRSVYKTAFAPHQKIVFYSKYKPTQKFLDHIQRAASRIDISNFFILIVCPHDIEKKLLLSCAKFGDPNMPIQSMIVPISSSLPMDQSTIVATESLCPLPFAMMEIKTDGRVAPCCKFRGSIGDSNFQTLDEIFYGEKANHIRHQMIEGEYLRECETCWQIEKTGAKSMRSHALDKYGAALDQDWLDDVQVRDITWSPSTLCNFKCRVCSPNSSSSIAVENIKFSNNPQEKTRLAAELKQSIKGHPLLKDQIINFKSLQYLHFLGGEPFLWPEIDSIIDCLVNDGKARDLHLEFNTNGSIYDDRLMRKIVDRFAGIEILLSIDNTGEKFEIERGGSWQEIRRNIEQFAVWNRGNTQIKIAPTVNIQNVLDLETICNFAQSLGLGIVWGYLETPASLCIDYVTADAKQLIVDKYKDSDINEIQKIVQRLQQAPLSDGVSFIDYVKTLDRRRNQDFSLTHKEIFEAMGGC